MNGLLLDLYELTMAQGYWKSGLGQHEAVFHAYFRKNPYAGGYAVACGLEPAVEFMESFGYADDDLAYLAGLPGSDGRPLFEPGFLELLRGLRLECDVDGVSEGTVVSAPEPLLRVQGPLLQCQLLETALLNILNFQTLIATKASRVFLAAGGAPVLEFGLRRAQGMDGGLSASRAAYIGGCAATSNVLAGKRFGIPVRGTHAHSWVMAFETELEAFQAYADNVPGDPVFLVDTYDTLEGVRHAIQVGRLAGIRLDSGDLLDLSIKARRMLDEAGFKDAFIAASNDLDEHEIARLRAARAPIDVWGVGTRLVTGGEQAALGGVYKLSCLRPPGGEWRDVVKLAGEKTSYPGILQVRRFPGRDLIFDLRRPPEPGEDLLVPALRSGHGVLPALSLGRVRERTLSQLASLPLKVEVEQNVEEARHARIALPQVAAHDVRVPL